MLSVFAHFELIQFYHELLCFFVSGMLLEQLGNV